ncbi:hypothetical protein PENSPDRAFT_344092 [Peniophora sp. CONT]|nr:hypothetical protein PENSPDRAFT_344092 [Peniophora sp. CONT]
MPSDWNSKDVVDDDMLIFLRLFHALFGIVVWEYISTFDYELDVWLGKRKYLWTVWLYSSCRMLLLLWLFTLAVQQNGGVTTHCTAFFLTCVLFSYFAIGMASIIIALRVIAIWKHSKMVKALSYGLIATSFALNMRDVSLVRAEYDPDVDACIPFATYKFLPNGIGILATDVILVVLMLVGLLRMEEARRSGIAKFLYHQGLLWFVLVVIAEVPTIVFVSLNLNDVLTVMLHPFEVAALSLCATRMYRGLTDYEHEPESLKVPGSVQSGIRFQSQAE